MTEEQLSKASELLFRHWLEGTQLDALPREIRPSTRAEAYGIQSRLEQHSASPLFGWKIAATSALGQAHIGVSGPLAGRLLAERVIPSGGECVLGHSLMKVAELEFAFRMGRDMEPRHVPYEYGEIVAHIDSVHPAIEIPDSRYRRFETAGETQLIADNACAHQFVLGPAAEVNWRKMNFVTQKAYAYMNGKLVEEGSGANVLGDPLLALTWLVNELSLQAITLKAGQVITTGTCIRPLAIRRNDMIKGNFGCLGEICVKIT